MSDESLHFQILGSTSQDVRPLDESGKKGPPEYQILLFGSMSTGESVSCAVTGFEPYFYVELPLEWTPKEITAYQRYLTSSVHRNDIAQIRFSVDTTLISVWDFTNYTPGKFLKITTKTSQLWRKLREVCLDKETSLPIPFPSKTIHPSADATDITLRVFEANIDPMLRFFHIRELPPAGWVVLNSWDDAEDAPTSATRQLTVEWDRIGPASAAIQLTSAPLRMQSWDIECTSSHGDFPLAEKTWRKPARELVESGLIEWSQIVAALDAAINDTRWPLSALRLPPTISLQAWARLETAWKSAPETIHSEFMREFNWSREDASRILHEVQTAGLKKWAHIEAAILAAAAGRSWPLSRIYVEQSNPLPIFRRALETITPVEISAFIRTIQSSAEDVLDAVDRQLSQFISKLTVAGDPIIQIGAVLYTNGRPVRKDIFVLGSCARLAQTGDYPTNTYACASEKQLIRKWCDLIKELDPDIMMGYNLFKFDDAYLWKRAVANNCEDVLTAFSRQTGRKPKLVEKQLGSSAMGDNTFNMIDGVGRLHIDLLPYVKRNFSMDSYSLDSVTAKFMSGVVTGIQGSSDSTTTFIIKTKSTKGTLPGRFIVLLDEDNDIIGGKLEVLAVEPKALHVRGDEHLGEILAEHAIRADGSSNYGPPLSWSQSKDDVSPQDIFRLHTEGAAGRAIVAKYCIQDCDLVMELFQKLEVLNNSIAMANVCWVPVDFIFMRGQGIKSESLVMYECRKEGFVFPVLPAPPQKDGAERAADADAPLLIQGDDNESYEGAIVLNPLSGIYMDDEPVSALDFSSLYPTTAISENYSFDSVVSVKDYDLTGAFVRLKEGSDTYDNLPDWDYLNASYDILKPDPADTRKDPKLICVGKRICRYAQHKNPTIKGILPRILQKLLRQRKATRKLAETEVDDFRKALLDALQLAYKLTGNSIYGQLGSATSKIRRKCLAASITAHGREQLLFSKAAIETVYGPKAGDPRCEAVAVYGDTDSVFISFRPKNPVTGERLRWHAGQLAAKALTEEAGQIISGALKPPHDFEFDKMFKTFILLSKKRYVGDMTEGDMDGDAFKYERKSMGIAIKRRDYVPIVKFVYRGVVERILNQHDVHAAFLFAQETVRDLLAGKFPMKYITMTKNLKAEYKIAPAHKILADRIGKRDPGNRPASNDRIPFVYFIAKNDKVPQCDRIELPSFIVAKGLKIDYAHYVTNQIQSPISQVFAIVLEKLPGFRRELILGKRKRDPVEIREDAASELLFGQILRDAARTAAGQRDIRSMFKAAV